MEEIRATYGTSGPMIDRVKLIFGDLVNGISKLNIGCGGNLIPGWINVDSVPGPGVGRAELPDLPFPDNQFDVVLASHVLEHVEKPMESVYEIHRVLRPGGRLLVVVPHAWNDAGLCNPVHRNYFTVGTFVYFRADTYNQPGTAGYGANEGHPVADWASVKVGMVPMPAFRHHPRLEYLAEHQVNIVAEVVAALTKRA